jgi:hypothetical protein
LVLASRGCSGSLEGEEEEGRGANVKRLSEDNLGFSTSGSISISVNKAEDGWSWGRRTTEKEARIELLRKRSHGDSCRGSGVSRSAPRTPPISAIAAKTRSKIGDRGALSTSNPYGSRARCHNLPIKWPGINCSMAGGSAHGTDRKVVAHGRSRLENETHPARELA